MKRFSHSVMVVLLAAFTGACGARGPAMLPPDRSARVECPPSSTPRPVATGEEKAHPGKLSRKDIQRAMEKLKSDILSCSDSYSYGTTITVQWRVGSRGNMLWAETTGRWANTWIGYCAAKVVCKASLPVSAEALTVTYPFEM